MQHLLKKLTMVMGATLVLQCSAVTTQAMAEVHMVRENMVVAKGTVFVDVATAPAISITFEDAIRSSSGVGYEPELFYVEIKGAEFTDKMFSQEIVDQIGAISLKKEDKTVMQVVIQPTSITENYIIPLLVKMTGDEAEVRIRAHGSNTTVPNWGEFTDEKEEKPEQPEEEKPEQQEPEKESDEKKQQVTVTFTVNSSTYTYNGEKLTMDAVPFIEAPGAMMVPIRYVAKAAGVEEDITFDQGAITLGLKEGGQLILRVDSKTYELKGEKGELQVPAMIKEGRAYIPVGAVARLLGVQTSWDPATKTASFSRDESIQ